MTLRHAGRGGDRLPACRQRAAALAAGSGWRARRDRASADSRASTAGSLASSKLSPSVIAAGLSRNVTVPPASWSG